MTMSETSVGILTSKLKHGLVMLPSFKRITSRLHMLGLFGAGIGLAGLMFSLRERKIGNLLIAWTSEGKATSKSSSTVAGLQNLGNNCFFNVVLQALASCSCFFSHLEDMLNDHDSETKEAVDEMALTVALESLLKDLRISREAVVVLSPRKIMLAMSLHITSFNLTRQQDAAEAFLHLMSSLEDELLEHYTPYLGSLADITSLPGNIVSERSAHLNDFRQWQRLHLGPFDGTIGSILVCTSCKSQLSIDFQIFRCLPLSPILEDHMNIMGSCTLADCLQRLTAVERLESHHCAHCWHNKALKFLSFKEEENVEKIKKIRSCFRQDSCDCASLLHDEVTCLNGSAPTLKKICIANCPKVLCLHLQRASINHHGELIKLKGHVSFPLFMDLFPFTIAADSLMMGNIEEHRHYMPLMQQPSQLTNMHVKHQSQVQDLIFSTFKHTNSAVFAAIGSDGKNKEDSCTTTGRSDFSDFHLFSRSGHPQQDRKASQGLNSITSKSYIYHLVAVVEHYGKPGSGHYAVYRKLNISNVGEYSAQSEDTNQHWFYISDSEVSKVKLEAVISAEATLLFYERIES